ncbi:MAG: UDP-N-acetylmuramoyl-tripeptide--D-alanyl-D-alanine ligase [bacterium]
MTSPIFIISTIFGLPALVISILSQAEFWQRKEYRLDRVLAALLSPELSSAIRPYVSALIFAVIGWVFLSRGNLPLANAVGFVGLIIILGYHLKRAVDKGFFRPRPTTKAMLLLLTTALLTIAYLFNSSFPKLVPFLHWATVVLLIPAMAGLAVNIINLLTDWRKHQIINQAARHRQKLTRLKVIGITGSYGKTSTKHFLAQLLPDAVISREHRNSEFPIAQDMLEQLNPASQIYIVEMGAYCRGEIKTLANLTLPHIGIITAIGNQHLATFGSPEKILQTKWELIEALPKDGIAILNADDHQLQKQRVTLLGDLQAGAGKTPGVDGETPRVEEAPASTIYYSTKKPADIYVENIDVKPLAISCCLHIKDYSSNIDIPLAGEASLGSVAAAVTAAHALGVDPDQIIDRLKHLEPYPKTMETIITKEGSTVIDDSYSANEQGVLAAIHHLRCFTQSDKRIVLVPLIELGNQAKAAHRRIGQALAESGATVYIYGNAYQKELMPNFKNNNKIHIITKPKDLHSRVTKNLTPQTVILLEGRLPKYESHFPVSKH